MVRVILPSRADEMILFADSEAPIRNRGLSDSALIEVGSDHRLANSELLEMMLESCEAVFERNPMDNKME